ncbi:hypothetical protein LSCM1_02384 [Leishmania martiniquensis]|uniref:Uncharacterized protein n=1 Tax=Leishmania martiniquensis TaxID=1580590 RepID=A0A836G8C2_9TRYP|nr:hypothetical protein LSCM1_02384 [Leishmania martiniquensis]
MSSEDESSWRLLFGIALSHGEALKAQRLSFQGWMMYLSSAQLVGATTGVFPLLLDQLWQRQSVREDARQARSHECQSGTVSVSSHAFSLSVESSHTSVTSESLRLSGEATEAPLQSTAAHEGKSVGFSGFVDMMNVICVRIFQTWLYTTLREAHEKSDEGGGESAILALRQSAEDHVLLTESVKYTAGKYLIPFISRCVIHPSSQVRLRPSQNGWAPHVNRLVTHIVGALLHTAILPLFRKYAAVGRLTEAGYRIFLRDILPELDPVEETCAVAVFHHGSFPDIRPILKSLQPLAASTSPELAAVVSEPTLGLTDFIEAILMLAVVVYADEVRYPNQRPITAKVWSFFQEYVCSRAFHGAVAFPDPYVTGRYAMVPPGIVSVYPAVAPLPQCPCLFVEVINMDRDNAECVGMLPPTVQSYNEGSQSSPFLTDVATVAEAEPQLCTSGDRNANVYAALQAAATFFMAECSLVERNRYVPLFGCSHVSARYEIMISGAAAEAVPTECPEILKLPFPHSLQQPMLYRCAVEAVAETAADGCGEEGAVYIQFTPFRSLLFELAVSDEDTATVDDGGESAALSRPWGCGDVAVTEAPLVQVIPPHLLARLHTLFLSQTLEPSDSVPAASAPPRLSLSAVCELCRQLRWCAASTTPQQDVLSICAQAWADYCDFQRILHPAMNQHEGASTVRRASSAADDTMPSFTGQTALLSFTDFIGCLAAVLFHKQGGRLSDVPDVPRRLELALHTMPPAFASGADTSCAADTELQASKICSIPHNALRDVPFLMALERKGEQSKKALERRAALIASLREYRAVQITLPVTLPPLPEDRPSAMRLVSQYGTVNPTEVFRGVVHDAAEIIKSHFLEQELSIPERGE